MEELIKLNAFPVNIVLKLLLEDKTTNKNIIWATNSYESYGTKYLDDHQMTAEALLGLNEMVLQPRSTKALCEQQERTKTHAEVFTPAWICNKMNNVCDKEWFGKENVFNIETEQTWIVNEEKIKFKDNKDWQKYIDSRRLEITCGEAPYLVSRYDSSTGKIIPIKQRIGILDRKLRVITENTNSENDWIKWAIRAIQSIYGFEYQGDNLLIGRINVLLTFEEYIENIWDRKPTEEEIKKAANIISWNLWQMDGLTGTVPLGIPEEENHQYSIFEFLNEQEEEKPTASPRCKIYDWRSKNSLLYESLKRRNKK